MVPLFRKILIATDGSENNRSAICEAMRLAQALGSDLVVVYVIDTGVLNSAAFGEGADFVLSSLKAEGDKAIGLVRELAKGTNVAVDAQILQGKPASAITSFAAKNGIDLIVVGASGKSGIEELLLGSVADRVIRTASCPVLVVKT
jgi:nucleotide-binding universal stress UspA family protein